MDINNVSATNQDLDDFNKILKFLEKSEKESPESRRFLEAYSLRPISSIIQEALKEIGVLVIEGTSAVYYLDWSRFSPIKLHK